MNITSAKDSLLGLGLLATYRQARIRAAADDDGKCIIMDKQNNNRLKEEYQHVKHGYDYFRSYWNHDPYNIR